MFIIGIDPHKGSHTAAVIDRDEQLVGEVSVVADRRQRDRLLRWAAPFAPRVWAVEGATGVGALLAQQLVACGESVVDVPAVLSARARLLDSGRKDKTDAHDARSAAVVALRHHNLRAVELEDHRQILRLLARRHHQLTAARTRAICRLHAVLCEMLEGGLSKNLSAKRASAELRKLRPHDVGQVEHRVSARASGCSVTVISSRQRRWAPCFARRQIRHEDRCLRSPPPGILSEERGGNY